MTDKSEGIGPDQMPLDPKMKTILKAELIQAGKQTGIEISPIQGDQFMDYMEEMLNYNRHTNLTAIREPMDILYKHFIDSLLVLKGGGLHDHSSLIDVGSGAGFPGIPLGILRKDLSVTLNDSNGKRTRFLEQVSKKLGLDCQILKGRGEELGRLKNHREQYDYVTARAVSSLAKLSEYCLPLVKLGGEMIAMKGPDIQKEIEEGEAAISLLGGRIIACWEGTLPKGEKRRILRIQKLRKTPDQYPRNGGVIQRKPLS